MLPYPPWFTALDRRRIDEAHTRADAPGSAAAWGGFVQPYASEAQAVQAVLIVFDVVIDVLSSHREQRREDLEVTAQQLFHALIGWAYDQHPQPATRSLIEFANAVCVARDAAPWWHRFVERVTGANDPAPARPKLVRQAAWLAEHMKRLGIRKTTQLEKLGGPEHRTIDRVLEGLGTNSEDVLQKVANALNTAYGQARQKVPPISLTDIPRN